ncbi:Tfp pilus assembly protein FimT/FimU [Altericista sp. CCNU0014]|uniref:pilus assembly FimT family protein n=1 Tax=Altericista sp. CCNU0014 TaxID=3082949 RepID=UPI00384C36AE
MNDTRRRARKRRLRFQQWGFTLIEVLVIVMVVGIVSAIAAPSFGALLDSIKVNQTVTELRSNLQETQRQAIRANKVCETLIAYAKKDGTIHKNLNKATTVAEGCSASGDGKIPDGVDITTNIQALSVPGSSPTASDAITIRFVPSGSAEFAVKTAVSLPNLPSDPTGKVVAYIEGKQQQKKKCIAISNTLGLTRIGTYTGDIDPAAITDRGICSALDWKQQ